MMKTKTKFLVLVLAMVFLLPGFALAAGHQVYEPAYGVDYNVTYDETYMYDFMPGLEAHFNGYDAIDNMAFVRPDTTYGFEMFFVVPIHEHNETGFSVWRKAMIYISIYLGGAHGNGS